MRRALREAFLLPLHLYRRVISPVLRPHCRYSPSCSEYALDAVREYGVIRGAVLAAWRVMRCNPWSHGGVDPVAQQRLFRPRAAAR
ncbi:MAG: membrane protein insertion efficiency factor YidD [Thermoleophilaceae bacterium]